MSQLSTHIDNGIRASRAQAALWTVVVFTAGVALAFAMFVAFMPRISAAPAAIAPAKPVVSTAIVRDDYGLRQSATASAASVRDDFGLRPDAATIRVGSAAAVRDDYGLRLTGGASAGATSPLDDYGIRHR